MTADRYFHFSAEPLKLENRTYDQSDIHKGWLKPVGLWFSVNDDEDGWRQWCETESFHLDDLKHKTEVILKSDANILYLRSSKCFDTFTEKYVGKTRLPGLLGRLHQEWPDWESVAKEYDGIIIAPYNWEYRLNPETIWYYPWDCASGCIWNISAIEHISSVEI